MEKVLRKKLKNRIKKRTKSKEKEIEGMAVLLTQALVQTPQIQVVVQLAL